MSIKHLMIATAALTGAAVLAPAAIARDADDKIVVEGEHMSVGEARSVLSDYLQARAGAFRIMGTWKRGDYLFANVSNNLKSVTDTYRVHLASGKVERLKYR